MKHNGFSFVETCLSVVIFFVIIGAMIPLSYQLKTTRDSFKLEYYASEVAFEGAKMINEQGVTSGTKKIDNIQFDWNYYGDKLCVTYKIINSTKKKCIQKSN